MEFVLATYGRQLVATLACVLAAMGVEMLFPQGPQPSAESRLRGLVFYALMTVGSTVAAAATLVVHLKPLFTFELAPSPLRFWLATLIGWLMIDLAFFMRHRLEHVFAWRFHAVHHAVRDLNAASSYQHWTDPLFAVVFATLPLGLLMGAPATILSTILWTAHASYLHSASRVHFGPLRYIIADNRYHRIHHGRDPRFYGKNFAASFPIWDVITMSAYFPRSDEWPETGLDDTDEARSISDFVFGPFSTSR